MAAKHEYSDWEHERQRPDYAWERRGYRRAGRVWEREHPDYADYAWERRGYGRERPHDWEREWPYDWVRLGQGQGRPESGREEEGYAGGPYAGRGPKGYRRSDERIREDVCDRLADHPQIDASEIEVEVHNGEVTLAGTVDNRYAKRLAEDIADTVSGVQDIHNRLRVAQRQESARPQTTNQNRPARTTG